MIQVAKKKFCVVYNDLKLIKNVVSIPNDVLFSKWNIYGSNSYSVFKKFIYDNNLYSDSNSKINYEELEKVQSNITSTLFKYDD